MAQTQRAPGILSTGYAGRADLRAASEFQLAPLRTLPAQQHALRGPAPPPTRLATLEPSLPTPASFAPPRTGAIPVSALLSATPPPQTGQQRSEPALSHRAFTHAASISPHSQPLGQPHPHHITSHRLDHPPNYPGQPSPRHHAQQYRPAALPSQPQPRPAERADSYYSPTSRSHSSSRSYLSSPIATSPQTGPAPPATLPELPFVYTLTIRQQPLAARACGFGERDRRVIDPPPILQLRTTDRVTGAPAADHNAMFALHCTLLHESTDKDETQASPGGPEMPATRKLMGTLVASPYPAKDEHGVAGTFFVFPDLSCRNPGKHRLHFKLLRIDPMNMTKGAVHGAVASVVTDIFDVYPAKDFPGMRASSALLKALRRQGLNVGVKKGSEARKGKGKKGGKGGSDEDEDDDEDEASDEDETGRGSGNTASGEGGEVAAKIAAVASANAVRQGKTKKRRRRDS
nr:hypothetical protein B0A51_00576 [Rachicladosporium sp. CCFEE 5018]